MIMGPIGSKFCLVANQQTPKKGESENSSILSHGRLKLKYETMYDLFANLKVCNNPSMHQIHWLNTC